MSRLIPTFGILVFIALYIYSASLYPGGNPSDPNTGGWDWGKNLWCHLIATDALNGLENPASLIARFAAAVLATSLAVFYFLCAKFFVESKTWSTIIRIAGISLLVSALFIFTQYHDIMTTILSLCGLMGIIGIIRALYLNRMTFFFGFGVVCLLIIGLNNLFYYNQALNPYLPLVQHLDFVLIFAWTVGLNFKMLNMNYVKIN